MTTIILVRHGETDWNRNSRFQGQADPPLNDSGREQARELAGELAEEPVVAAYSSPLRRAHETATIIAAELGVPVETKEALREIDVGSWSGLTRDEVGRRFPDAFARWTDGGAGWEDGESYEEMGRRVVATLEEIAAQHAGEVVLVVSHGGPVRAAIARARGIRSGEMRRERGVLGNCELARIAVQDGSFRELD